MSGSDLISSALHWTCTVLRDGAGPGGVLDTEGRWLGVNEPMIEALGQASGETVIGLRLDETMRPGRAPAGAKARGDGAVPMPGRAQKTDEVLKRGQGASAWKMLQARLALGDDAPRLYLVIKMPSGALRTVESCFTALRDEAGVFLGFVMQGWDISEQVARELLLARTRDQHSLLIEANRIGVLEIDMLSGSVTCDALTEEALGYEPGQLEGVTMRALRKRHPQLVLTPSERSARKIFSKGPMQDQGGHMMQLIRRVRSARGLPIWLRLGVCRAPIPRPNGQSAVLVSVQNVTSEMERQVELDVAQQALQGTQWLIQAASEGSGVGYWTINLDTGIVWQNRTNLSILGVSNAPEETVLEKALGLVHPDDQDWVMQEIKRSRFNGDGRFHADFRVLRRDGSHFWVGASARGRKNEVGEFVLYGAMLDITHRVQGEEQLRAMAQEADAARKRLQLLAERVPGGMAEVEIDDNGRLNPTYVSAGFASVLRMELEVMENNPLLYLEKVHPDDLHLTLAYSHQTLDKTKPHQITYRFRDDDGGIRWLSTSARPHMRFDGRQVWYLTVFDVTDKVKRTEELEEAQRKTEFLALHDGLTGLPNRRYFDLELSERVDDLSDSSTPSQVLTLVRIDLDHFKHVNDTLGHDAGDAVLVHVAKTMNACLAEGDFAARLGGDEFAIIMAADRGTNSTERAKLLATQLRDELAQPLPVGSRTARFGASFGIACSSTLPKRVDKLLSYADAALYEAKEKGRGLVKVFSADLNKRMRRTQRIAQEIEEALESNQFEPHFHPQVDARTGRLAGFEVLARWHHPKRGVLPPIHFLEVAEQIKRVQDIDRIIFERALVIGEGLLQEGYELPKLSFNISWERLHDPEFLASVEAHQVPELPISFELLESILLEDLPPAMQFNLDSLREAGIGIEMDDFGSGRASVVGMMQVAPDAIKLDQRLVRPITEDKKAARLLASLVQIAQELDISVVAEGVETLEHASILCDLGCDLLQGYAFGRPMSTKALRGYLDGFAPYKLDVA